MCILNRHVRIRRVVTLVVSLVALGVCASSASAEPLSMTFTESRANVGVQLSDAALFEAPQTAPLGAQIDLGSGAIAAGTLGVPDFLTHITEPIDADVSVDFDIGEIEGSFVQATGALTLKGTAGGTLTAQSGTFEGEKCTVATVPEVLELSTAGNNGGASPRSGAPFAAGLAGPGAIAGQWTDMTATPVEPGNSDNVSFCNNVDSRIGGPGGIWLDQKGSVDPPKPPIVDPPKPPTADPPPVCVVPKVAGMKLKPAKKKIRAANCTVGKVRKPKGLKGKGLVVKSSNPVAGATKPAGAKVHLRLGPKS